MSAIHYVRPGLKRRLIESDEPLWLRRHPRRPYLVRAILSAPYWAVSYRAEFEALRRAAKAKGHTLDHIVPLSHPRVCGLTVPWNLQVIPRATNARKGNAWCQWHGELFDQPEQLRLC